ncbi:MAG: hypothetical protein P9X24_13150 [Candidatus Hatepunaea meridiana]|nr:hypothetical protein [Candidatus Hatepunaea meridiana]
MAVQYVDTSENEISLMITDAFTVVATVGFILIMAMILASDFVKGKAMEDVWDVNMVEIFNDNRFEGIRSGTYYRIPEEYREAIKRIEKEFEFGYKDSLRISNINSFVAPSFLGQYRQIDITNSNGRLWKTGYAPNDYIDAIYRITFPPDSIQKYYIHRLFILPPGGSMFDFDTCLIDVYFEFMPVNTGGYEIGSYCKELDLSMQIDSLSRDTIMSSESRFCDVEADTILINKMKDRIYRDWRGTK